MMVEATGLAPKSFVHLVSPTFVSSNTTPANCLNFKFSAYGAHVGKLRVLDQFGNVLFLHKNSLLNSVDVVHVC